MPMKNGKKCAHRHLVILVNGSYHVSVRQTRKMIIERWYGRDRITLLKCSKMPWVANYSVHLTAPSIFLPVNYLIIHGILYGCIHHIAVMIDACLWRCNALVKLRVNFEISRLRKTKCKMLMRCECCEPMIHCGGSRWETGMFSTKNGHNVLY